nr:TetR/AcrR family transcriptional regulator [Paenibacillus sp. SYP-B3998]
MLNAALEIFTEKGYYETKVSDIVKKAGVAQGTFYLYFQTKESIFTSIIKSTNEVMIDQVERIFTEKASPLMSKEEFMQRLHETVYSCMSVYRDHKAIMYMMRVHGASQFGEAEQVVEAWNECLLGIIIKLFHKFQLFPSYNEFQFEIAARAIDGMLNETCMQYLILRDSTDEQISQISGVVTEMIYDMTLGRTQ